jgi:hypothetical protein
MSRRGQVIVEIKTVERRAGVPKSTLGRNRFGRVISRKRAEISQMPDALTQNPWAWHAAECN